MILIGNSDIKLTSVDFDGHDVHLNFKNKGVKFSKSILDIDSIHKTTKPVSRWWHFKRFVFGNKRIIANNVGPENTDMEDFFKNRPQPDLPIRAYVREVLDSSVWTINGDLVDNNISKKARNE